MNWSNNKDGVTPATVAETVARLHGVSPVAHVAQFQPALDALAQAATAAVKRLPEGASITLNSHGYENDQGGGSVGLSFHLVIQVPAPATEEEPPDA
jgi:ABC-type transport system substrate-binding protein